MPTPCPRCGYDQSGVIDSWTHSCPLQGTCSECGLAFRWVELLRPELFLIPWLFEHARGRLPYRFYASAARSLLPWRFWSTLALPHALRPRRLLAFLVLLFLLAYLWACFVAAGANAMLADAGRAWHPDGAYVGSFFEAALWGAALAPIWHTITWHSGSAILPASIPLLWVLLMTLSYFLLIESLGKARVRPIHLLRALAYCMPATLLVWGHALTLVFQNAFWWTSPNLLARAVMDSTSFTGYLWVAWSFLYWHSFTSRYLRLDHPFLVTLLLLILSGLATAAIVVYGGNGLHSLSEFFA